MNRKARAFVLAVVAVGAAVGARAVATDWYWIASNILLFGVVLTLVIAAERFVIHLPLKKETISLSVSEAPLTFALMLFPPGAFIAVAAAGVLGAQLIRRRPPLKAAFNTAMYAVSSAVAALTFRLMSSTDGELGILVGAAVAMAAFYLTNQFLVANVVAMVDRRPFREVLRIEGPVQVAVWAGNVCLGVVLYALRETPHYIPFLIGPFALAIFAYAGWIRGRLETVRMDILNRAGGELLRGLGSKNELQPFLTLAKELFRASMVMAVELRPDGRIDLHGDDGGTETIGTSLPIRATEGALLNELKIIAEQRQWKNWEAAATVTDTELYGALVVEGKSGPEGPEQLSERDRELLSVLSQELSMWTRNLRLFQDVSEERAKLREVLDNTSDGIFQTSLDRKILIWTPAMEHITGYSSEEAVGETSFTLLRIRDSRGLDMCLNGCRAVEGPDRPCTEQHLGLITRRDGGERWINYMHSPVLDNHGQVHSIVSVVRDVTKEHAIQELKDDFVAMVSHELRTPITPIKGFLLTLLRDGHGLDEADQRKIMERMLGQTNRLERLVQDLLKVSEIDATGVAVSLEDIDIVGLAQDVCAEVCDEQLGRVIGVISEEPSIRALADPEKLRQCLRNLIDNAIRYGADPIEILIGRGDDVVISVRDHGKGMCVDDQEKIFDRFFRAGHHLTRTQGGTGLGLYITQRFITAMDGKITVSSEPGNGATFSLHLNRPPAGARLTKFSSSLHVHLKTSQSDV